jgi:hypothetical protein
MLLLLLQTSAAGAYSLDAESGTLVISGTDVTLTYTPIVVVVPPEIGLPGGGAVLAGSGRRRPSGSWRRLDEEKTPQERAAYEAELDRRLDEEARDQAAAAAAAAEAYRLANLRHFTLHATGTELHVTKKRSHKLIANRSMRAGERFVLIRPSLVHLTRTHLFAAESGAIVCEGGNAEMIHRSVTENLALAQNQLKRIKDDHEAITLLLLAA